MLTNPHLFPVPKLSKLTEVDVEDHLWLALRSMFPPGHKTFTLLAVGKVAEVTQEEMDRIVAELRQRFMEFCRIQWKNRN
jgi:hypothetical protein